VNGTISAKVKAISKSYFIKKKRCLHWWQ